MSAANASWYGGVHARLSDGYSPLGVPHREKPRVIHRTLHAKAPLQRPRLLRCAKLFGAHVEAATHLRGVRGHCRRQFGKRPKVGSAIDRCGVRVSPGAVVAGPRARVVNQPQDPTRPPGLRTRIALCRTTWGSSTNSRVTCITRASNVAGAQGDRRDRLGPTAHALSISVCGELWPTSRWPRPPRSPPRIPARPSTP